MLSEDPVARRRLAAIVAGIMLFFGVLFVYVTPPYQGPDETAHFARIAMIVGGDLLPETKDGVAGVYLPDSLLRFEKRHAEIQSDLDAKYDYKRVVAEIRAGSSLRPKTFTTIVTQATSPLMYAPALVGVATGSLLTAFSFADFEAGSWATLQYFARLGNLFVFALAVAAAMSALPRFHAGLAFVALMPMTMFLSASVQYDSMSLLACLGLFVVVVRCALRGGGFSRRELLLLAVAAFFLGHGKIVYLPLLLALVPIAVRAPRRDGLLAIAVAAAAAFLGLAGSLLFSPLSGQPTALIDQQVAVLLADLSAIPGLIWRTLAEMHGYYFRTLFGHFGWLDTAVPPSLLILVWAALLLAIVNDSRGPVRKVGGWLRLAIGAGIVIAVVGIMLALYIIWTPTKPDGVGSPIVIGVQGRYFIPFLPFAMMAVSFNLRRLAPRLDAGLPSLLPVQLALQAALLAVSLLFLFLRYWV